MSRQDMEIRGVPVCVVGGAGFLGSHLVNHLIDDRACDVTVIDNLCAGRREFIHKKAHFVHADITDSEDYLRRVFQSQKVQYVINTAAYPYVPDSYARPSHVCNVNFHGAMNVINAADEAKVTGILQISSAEVYGENYPDLGTEIDEQYPVTPRSTYGASKAAIDFYVQCRWREAKTPCMAVRQFNALGERDVLHPYVLVEVVRQLRDQSRSSVGRILLGNNSSRDFIYAGDAVRMWVELLEKGQFGECYNLGSAVSIKVYDLAKMAGEIMGFPSTEVIADEKRRRPWDIWHLSSNSTKLYSVIGSRLTMPLREAVEVTIKDLLERGFT